jgi:hypothetical protein
MLWRSINAGKRQKKNETRQVLQIIVFSENHIANEIKQ